MPVMHCRLKVVTYNKYKQDTYGITTGVMPNNCNAITPSLLSILPFLACMNCHIREAGLHFGFFLPPIFLTSLSHSLFLIMPCGKKPLNTEDISQVQQPVSAVDCMQAFILCFFSDYESCN
jgi:hypothetical protein